MQKFIRYWITPRIKSPYATMRWPQLILITGPVFILSTLLVLFNIQARLFGSIGLATFIISGWILLEMELFSSREELSD